MAGGSGAVAVTGARRRGGLVGRVVDALGRPQGLLLGTVLVLMAAPVVSPIRDPDFWWHLRTGQLIASRGGLLGTDPYTYTVSGHHWVMHEWLTELLFAALHAVGGLGLIVLVLSVATWLGLLTLLLRARAMGAGGYALAAGLFLGVISGYPIWGPRAQMETFFFSCITIWLVDRQLRRGGRAGWALVPLMLVWSNLHSGFVFGIGIFILMLAAEFAERRLHPADAVPAAHLRLAAWMLAACLVIVVVNPNGPGIYLYPFQTQTSPAQQSLIQEWHSPDFHDALVTPFEVMLLTLSLLLVVNRRAALRDLVITFTTVVLSFQSERNIALFIAAATPLWCQQASLAGTRAWDWWRARRRRRAAPAPRPSPGFALLSVAVLMLLASVPLVRLRIAMATQENDLSYAQTWPVCASQWLLQAPGGLHIFNQYGEGGYLAYALSAHGDRVFIFGDAALMGDAQLLRYGDVEDLQPDWYDVITNRGGTPTDVVLFDTGTPLAHLLDASPRFVRVYEDPHNEAWVPVNRPQVLRELPPQQRLDPNGPGTCSQLLAKGNGS